MLEAQLGACGILITASSVYFQLQHAGGLRAAGGRHPQLQLDHVVGVLKAYSTCVGAGPFAAENAMGEVWNEQLAQGRRRVRCRHRPPAPVGPFDCVASRYGLAMQVPIRSP